MKKRYSGKTPGRFMPIYNLLTFICLLYAFAGNAQCVSLTTLGSASTQSFNTLANTGTTNNLTITGWFMTEEGSSMLNNEQYGFDDGGSNSGDTYSYGVDANFERALGGLQTGTLIPVFGSCFTNNTGYTITSLDINYFGEQWRIANSDAARDDRMDFQYSLNATSLVTGTWVDVNALDFTNPIKTAMSVGALDGNNIANRTNIVSSITGLSIPNGATFWIRWNDFNASGADDGLAVDDFSITPQGATVNLAITKSDGGASAMPGGVVAYTLSYSNTGSQGATGVVITETIPANTTFNAATSSPGWVCVPNNNAGGTCTLAVGNIAASGNGAATFAVTVVNPVASGVTQISNTATITDDGTNGADTAPSNNTGSDVTPVNAAPDLTITKSDGGASVIPGGTIAYTLSYSNTGNQGATGVVISETVPANTTFNGGASTPGWVCAPNGNAGSTCTLAVGNVAGGASGSATFAVTVANPVPGGVTQISNTASISDNGTNGSDPTPGNNSGSDVTPLSPTGDLDVFKFRDINKNGVFNGPGGEMPLEGWEIKVFAEGADTDNDAPLYMGMTDMTGHILFSGIPQGNYIVCEEVRSHWTITTGTVCRTVSVGAGTTNVEFANFENRTYTFRKVSTPATNAEVYFDWTLQNLNDADPGDLTVISDDPNGTVISGGPNLFTITELVPTGWKIDKVVCNGQEMMVTDNSITFDTRPAETDVECTFYNVPLPSCSDGIQNGDETGVDCGGSFCPPCTGDLDVFKFRDINKNGVFNGPGGEMPLEGWEIKVFAEGADTDNDAPLYMGTTDMTGHILFSGIPQGNYIVCEEERSHWTITTGTVCRTVSVGAGTTNVEFANFENRTYTFRKVSTPATNAEVYFDWTLQNLNDADPGDLTVISDDPNGTVISGGPNLFTITELVPTGWKIDKVVCNGQEMMVTDNSITFDTRPAETDVECTFYNVPLPSCSDGIQNGDETGVDCGGSNCPACPPATTLTVITSNLNPSFTGNNVTFTATVTSGGNPVTTGTVDFKEGAITLASNVALNGSGQATFSTAALTEGSHSITAFYNGATGFNTSNGSMVQVVNNMTVVNGNSFCNEGVITLADGNTGGITGTPGTPYPSNILVSGLVGTIQSITVDVKGLTHPRASDIDLLLIAPTGETFLMMTGVGQFGTFSNTNLTLSDAAGSALPQIGGIPSGTYRPTSYEADNRNIFPAPAPAGPYNKPAPQGAATFASVFNGLNPNGTWQLYATDDTTDQVGSIVNGWCLNIVVPTCTPPTITDEPDAVTVCESSAASFTVAATGAGTLSYQWQEDGVDLMNTGVYSNVTTATLNISNTTGLNGKMYKVIITNDNGTPDDASDDCSSTSEEVILTVLDPQAGTLGATNPVICEGGDLGLTHTGFSGVNNFGTIAFRKSDGSFIGAGPIDGPNSAIEQAIEAAGPGEYCIIAFAQFTKPGDFETGACGINPDGTTFAFAPLDAFRACLQDQLDKGVCVDWDEFCVTVNPKPDISASATSTTICNGETTTLNFTPTTDLTVVGWFLDDDDAGCNPMGGSLSTGTTFEVSPSSTTTYAVVVQNSDGCRDTACVTITVNPKPDITANATQTTICNGETTTLNFTPTTDLTVVGWFLDDDDAICNPMGASLSTGTTFEVSPTSTTTYAVVVQNSDGCRDTACVTITVNPIPTATVTAMSPICPGEDAVFTITATPNTSVYANLNGGSPSPSPFFASDSANIGPSGMAIITIPNAMVNQTLSLYQVANYAPIYYQTSCRIVNIDESATVVISSNLNITAGATQTTICNGETTTLNFTPTTDLTVVGWFLDDDDAGCNPMGGSLSTGTTFEVSPNSTTTYAVVVEGSDGCRDTACVTINVNPKPDISASATETTICNGETTTLNFTPTTDITVVGWFLDDAAAGCNPMGGSLSTGTTFEVSPNSTTTYTVVVQNSDGCRDTACVTITVNPNPTITLGANPIVCEGETSANLTFTATTGDPNQYSIDFVDASFTDVTDVALGSSPIVIAIPANATAGMYAATLTVRNSTTGCSQTYNISVQVLNCKPVISDPCSCKNNATTLVNGQFNEAVSITAPSGQTWTVSAVTNLYQTTSPAPPAAPTLITIGTAFVETPNGDGTSTYTLVGLMVDATTYSLTATNGRGSTRMVDNICYYPNPAITGLDPAYCADEPAVILTGTIDRGDGQTAIPPQSAVFDINGTVATQFDPQALGAGTYTVGFTVDAAAEGANFPGCVQAVSQQVRVDPQVTVDAGTPQTICRTKTLALSALNASVQYSGTVADLIYTWSFVEAGNNGTLSGTSSTNLNAGTYTPGPAAIARGYVTLRLTVDNPNDACEPISDTVRVNIQNVDCGQFPWNGNN